MRILPSKARIQIVDNSGVRWVCCICEQFDEKSRHYPQFVVRVTAVVSSNSIRLRGRNIVLGAISRIRILSIKNKMVGRHDGACNLRLKRSAILLRSNGSPLGSRIKTTLSGRANRVLGSRIWLMR